MQGRLVDPAEGTQISAERRACPFTGVAMHFASAIPIIIPCPCVDAVTDRGMDWMTPPRALPRIGVQPRTASWQGLDAEPMPRPPVRLVAHPQTRLACLTRTDPDDRGAIVGIGAMACALSGASAGRIGGGAMGRAVFPPRADATRPPQRRCRRVWSGLRDSPHARARRAVGSPVAIPRSSSTSVAGR
jgi:hypothetical protein